MGRSSLPRIAPLRFALCSPWPKLLLATGSVAVLLAAMLLAASWYLRANRAEGIAPPAGALTPSDWLAAQDRCKRWVRGEDIYDLSEVTSDPYSALVSQDARRNDERIGTILGVTASLSPAQEAQATLLADGSDQMLATARHHVKIDERCERISEWRRAMAFSPILRLQFNGALVIWN